MQRGNTVWILLWTLALLHILPAVVLCMKPKDWNYGESHVGRGLRWSDNHLFLNVVSRLLENIRPSIICLKLQQPTYHIKSPLQCTLVTPRVSRS